MYNRYVPQSDGSYRRNKIPDQQPHPSPVQKQPPQPQPAQPLQQSRRSTSVASFLRNLLPADLDTGDLLIILLLLLMAEDEEGNSNNALLTLALYLFL